MNKTEVKVTALTPIISKHGKKNKLTEVEKDYSLISIYGYEFVIDGKMMNTMYYDITEHPYIYKIKGPVFNGKFAIKDHNRYIIFDTFEEMKMRLKRNRNYPFRYIDLSEVNNYALRFKDYEPQIASLPFNGRYFYLDATFLKTYLDLLIPSTSSSCNFNDAYVNPTSIKIYKKLNIQLSKNRSQVQTSSSEYLYEMGLSEGSWFKITIEDGYYNKIVDNKKLINDNSREVLYHTKRFVSYIRDISLYQHSIAISKLQTAKNKDDDIRKSSYLNQLSRVRRKSNMTVNITEAIIDNIDSILDYKLTSNQIILFAGIYLNEFVKYKLIDDRIVDKITQICNQYTIESMTLDEYNDLFDNINQIIDINEIFQSIDQINIINNKLPGVILLELEKKNVWV